ncbi:N-acyl homoserine lactonase family protein [Oricola indica]|jgi:glyoxylase-like metal-dependent hydrolase (beta-lactamase superfamily II)|uniref:N-acyl homoserine lactonase family protein n=1 Tax=Oricola indica TaxID=2872591 RepID=UPI001CBCE7D9|nr:N-acyl homoserine lactonase family protein [Oricola indica]
MTCEITPLSFAEIEASEAVLFEGGAPSTLRPIGCFCWLLRAPDFTALVDTGISDFGVINATVKTNGRSWQAAGRRPIQAQLASAGLSPDDIDAVILTHLHYDHASNVDVFGRARFFVGEREWGWARGEGARAALPQLAGALAFLEALPADRLSLLPDSAEPLPGVRTRHVGGHTPGSIMVECETDAGRVIMPGDAIFLLDNLRRKTAIGLTSSPEESRAVIDLLSDFDGIVLPSHDLDAARQINGTGAQSC